MSARLVRINDKSRSLDVNVLSLVFVYEKGKRWINLIIKEYKMKELKDLKIAIANTGYVGLSIATLLFQYHMNAV